MARREDALSSQLRDALLRDGRPVSRIAKENGVSSPQVTRFVRGDRGLSLSTADRIAAGLGLQLTRRTA